MEISFTAKEGIQIVEIAGQLGESEAAAVRFKLDQKINQGRSRVLFDLGRYNLLDNAARDLLLGVILYCMNRDALVACAGVEPKNWPLLILPEDKRVKIFLSKNEGLDYLEKTPLPSAERKASLGPQKKKGDEEVKTKALEQLLKKYEIFQHADDSDPYRLGFLAEQYAKSPSSEALVEERKAQNEFLKVRDELKTLETECEGLAQQVKMRMLLRKIPLTAKELDLKQRTLDQDLQNTQNFIKDLETQAEARRDDVATLAYAIEKAKADFQLVIKDLEGKIEKTSQENEEVKKKLAALTGKA